MTSLYSLDDLSLKCYCNHLKKNTLTNGDKCDIQNYDLC